MRLVILCGGLRTRLREETDSRPKPMVEVGRRPLLWHIIKIYAHQGFREFVLCLEYRGNTIKEYFLNYEAMNNDFTMRLGEKSHIKTHRHHSQEEFRVTLADTGLDYMTGGRLRKVQKYLDDDTFMLTYGDGVSDVNIRHVPEFHKSHRKIATVTTVAPIWRFSMPEVGGEGANTRAQFSFFAPTRCRI
jgi:glucose-1-phosphate cytidylyltransferase